MPEKLNKTQEGTLKNFYEKLKGEMNDDQFSVVQDELGSRDQGTLVSLVESVNFSAPEGREKPVKELFNTALSGALTRAGLDKQQTVNVLNRIAGVEVVHLG